MQEFTYQIGTNRYTQRQMVFGQIRQLTAALRGMTLSDVADSPPAISPGRDLMDCLGERLHEVIAIVLIPDGCSAPEQLARKDNARIAADIEWTMDADTTIQVIKDFFDCNPATLAEELMVRLVKMLAQAMTRTASPAEIPTEAPAPEAKPTRTGKTKSSRA